VTEHSISERQNSAAALLVARAFRRRYVVARRWRMLRIGVGVLVGTVGILLALFERSTSDYVAAFAAAWIVFGRTVLAGKEQRERRCGAVTQECFDTDVFELPWSTSVVGPPPEPEDVRNWARREAVGDLRNWYPDPRPAQHPVDVLLCQRSIITWARQDHATYAEVLRWAVGVGLVATLVLAVLLDLSVGEYLLRLGVPVLPAALDVLDVAKGNSDLAAAKQRLEAQAGALLARARDDAIPPSVAECRDLQNGIFATRLLPGVPGWLYRFTRTGRQTNMEETVRAQVQSLPALLCAPASSQD
jgi:hypothetical protein